MNLSIHLQSPKYNYYMLNISHSIASPLSLCPEWRAVAQDTMAELCSKLEERSVLAAAMCLHSCEADRSTWDDSRQRLQSVLKPQGPQHRPWAGSQAKGNRESLGESTASPPCLCPPVPATVSARARAFPCLVEARARPASVTLLWEREHSVTLLY